MRRAAVTLAALMVCLMSCQAAAQQTVIVDMNGMGDYFDIQSGLDAVEDGGMVIVYRSYHDEGFPYKGPRNRGLDFHGKSITLWGISGSAMTVVDCQNQDRAILLTSEVDSTTVIRGFTFLNGSATGGGGSIMCNGASPRIDDCVFRDNESTMGGAVRVVDADVRMTACDFYDNHSSDLGGAISAEGSSLALLRCLFHGNTGDDGGAVMLTDSSLDMWRCSVAYNRAAYGAGVSFAGARPVRPPDTIEQSILAFNRLGKAVSGGAPEIFHCFVYGNEGGDDLPGNVHDNEFTDPLLCDLYGGLLSLCSNSECLQAANPWELHIGSQAQGCGDCDSPIEPASWGGLKALFRR